MRRNKEWKGIKQMKDIACIIEAMVGQRRYLLVDGACEGIVAFILLSSFLLSSVIN